MVLLRYIGQHQAQEERDVNEAEAKKLLSTGEWNEVNKAKKIEATVKSKKIEKGEPKEINIKE